jgi:hypothetical protein
VKGAAVAYFKATSIARFLKAGYETIKCSG